ncbi:hypothetical protein NCPPB1935_11515 [Xanthomonas campestris pv. nigromaculans]|nr:hypothetical protein NCPPB1935_11515 [Xanthomonas campestris pv. nigromaculans]
MSNSPAHGLAGAWLAATSLHPAANGSQNAGFADCYGMPMPATSGIRSAGGTPNARRFSSQWSRSSWWILANGETATSDASRDRALSVGAKPLLPRSLTGVLHHVVPIAGKREVAMDTGRFIGGCTAGPGALTCRAIRTISNGRTAAGIAARRCIARFELTLDPIQAPFLSVALLRHWRSIPCLFSLAGGTRR